MFIATFFIIAKICEQPKCPSGDKGIKKPWYVYTMEYYTAGEKEGSLTFCNSISGSGD